MSEHSSARATWRSDLQQTAHRLWLAGLGAFSLAGERGSELFDRLVEKGQGVEEQGKERAEAMGQQLRQAASRARDRGRGAWSKVDRTVDAAVDGTLGRAGFPQRGELEALSLKVESLTRAVEKLRQQA